eukprot:SAG22_NODE_10608_length_525_cov_1.183099_1_plen_105_part_10
MESGAGVFSPLGANSTAFLMMGPEYNELGLEAGARPVRLSDGNWLHFMQVTPVVLGGTRPTTMLTAMALLGIIPATIRPAGSSYMAATQLDHRAEGHLPPILGSW